jgi:YfiH family protein
MAWEFITENNISYFQYQHKNNLAIYTTKSSKEKFLKKFSCIFLKQIHSSIIINIDSKHDRIGDGLVSGKKDVALGIKIADCLPVYIFNDEKICIIHCGWRSIIKGIAKKAKKMLGNYKYIMGACIGSCCYEIKADLKEIFAKEYPDAIITRENKYFLDLKRAVKKDLGNKYLLDDLNLCTKCHPEYFYSFRRGDGKKRNYAIITAS